MLGGTKGASVTARLAVNACDPALQVIKKAIAYWTQAVWDESVPDATLRYAWKFACCNAIRSQRPSVTAGGAAGAFIAAIDRIEWKSPAPDCVQTRDGTVLNLRDVAPYTVAQYVEEDFQIVTAAATSAAKRITDSCKPNTTGLAGRLIPTGIKPLVHRGRLVPWFSPAAAVVNSRWASRMPPSTVASGATLQEGGWWPQERLANEGLAADPFCRACMTDTRSVVGSLWHRLCSCSGQNRELIEKCPSWLRKVAQENPMDPLFADGVPIRPACPAPPKPEKHWIGAVPHDGPLATG